MRGESGEFRNKVLKRHQPRGGNYVHFGPVNGQLFIFAREGGEVNNVAPAVATPHDGRKQPRTHLFVAATLYSDAGSVPVHIRNMSPSGALIDSLVIPEPGSKVVLKRASLQAVGRIAWTVERKAGVAFETTVFVADWMSRHTSPQQARIDEIVSGFKADSRSDTSSTVDVKNASGAESIEAELMTLRSDLAELETSLVGDAILVATHPEIQALDISLQRIDRIITSLRSAGVL